MKKLIDNDYIVINIEQNDKVIENKIAKKFIEKNQIKILQDKGLLEDKQN